MTKAKKMKKIGIQPVGWQLLIRPMKGPEKSGSIFLTDATKEENKIAASVCEILDMGPDCYMDDKFASGPWVSVGDYVLVGKFTGSRFNYQGEEFRLINDDQVIGTTDNPEGVTRVF